MSKKLENISRMDLVREVPHKKNSGVTKKQTHGWNVRVTRDGKTVCKFFSDAGDREKALQKAIEYRDQLLKEVPQGKKGGRMLTAKSLGGGSGVSTKSVVRGKNTHHYFVISFPDPKGIRKRKEYLPYTEDNKEQVRAEARTRREERLEWVLKERRRLYKLGWVPEGVNRRARWVAAYGF